MVRRICAGKLWLIVVKCLGVHILEDPWFIALRFSTLEHDKGYHLISKFLYPKQHAHLCVCAKDLGLNQVWIHTLSTRVQFRVLNVQSLLPSRFSRLRTVGQVNQRLKKKVTRRCTSIFMRIFPLFNCLINKIQYPFSDQSLLLYQLRQFTNLASLFFRSLLIIIVVTHIDGCNSLLWFLEETFEAILGAVQTIQAAKGPWEKNGLEDQDREISKVKMTGKIN